MRRISYSKFSEEDLGIEMEDLLRALSDYLLGSGFQDPYMQFSELNQHSFEDLKRAIEQALQSGDLFSPERLEQMREQLEKMLEFTQLVTQWYNSIDRLPTPALQRLFKGGAKLAKLFGTSTPVSNVDSGHS